MKTTREDWHAAGFALLREGGGAGLTIERLCGALERTKGAFYHHYADIQAFRTELLATWEESHTGAPIVAADSASAADRRRALYRAVADLDLRVERAVRAWSERDPVARAACDAVDERRVTYLSELWRLEGKSRSLALRLAELEYAAFVGLSARYGMEHRKHRAAYALLLRALGGATD